MAHSCDDQGALFAFLGDPASHGGAPVRRIDTHAAAVFLAGDHALKVKRAVRFPFLDYSTPEKRRAACAAELEVNRPFAPQIYRRLVAITRDSQGRLAFDGAGETVDWAVEMRRFDDNQTLDQVAGRGGIDPPLAEALGRRVAAAHAAMPPADAAAWIAALGDYIAQNATAFAEIPDLFPAGAVAALTDASRAACRRLTPLLDVRAAAGLIRRGHGDLHLGNIVLIDGAPVLFDAIEFDPVIASGDVLYDLAFLLMDLVERDLGPAANIVFNRYLQATGRAADLDALAALPLYLSLRAAIRAKVTAARLEQAAPADHAGIRGAARAYFDLAGRLIAPPPPRLVAVGGLSGTGKSVLGAALAPDIGPAPGAVLLRSDVARKALWGCAETAPLPSEAYRPEITAQVYARLVADAGRALAAGHAVLVDAVFAAADERRALAAIAAQARAPFTGLFLEADLAIRTVRIGGRRNDASDADAAVAARQEHYQLGPIDWFRIDAGGTAADTLARARTALRAGAAPR